MTEVESCFTHFHLWQFNQISYLNLLRDHADDFPHVDGSFAILEVIELNRI